MTSPSTAPSRPTSSAGASSTRSTRARASSAGASGRPSTTSARCATTRSRSRAFARGCRLCRRAATTTSPPRRSRASRTFTSAHSSLTRFGPPSPHPPASSCARASTRVFRTRTSSRNASPRSPTRTRGEDHPLWGDAGPDASRQSGCVRSLAADRDRAPPRRAVRLRRRRRSRPHAPDRRDAPDADRDAAHADRHAAREHGAGPRPRPRPSPRRRPSPSPRRRLWRPSLRRRPSGR